MSSDSDGYRHLAETHHPFRLRRIELDKFKSVDNATVELGPLSVIVGANSSGKSTLFQPILAMHQAVRSNTSSTRDPLSGDIQYLGSYQEVQNSRIDQTSRKVSSLVSSSTISHEEATAVINLFGHRDMMSFRFSITNPQQLIPDSPDNHDLELRPAKSEVVNYSITLAEDDSGERYSQVVCLSLFEVSEKARLQISVSNRGTLTVGTIPAFSCPLRLDEAELDEILANIVNTGYSEWESSREGDPPEDPPEDPIPGGGLSEAIVEISAESIRVNITQDLDMSLNQFARYANDMHHTSVTQWSVKVRDEYKGENEWSRSFSIDEDGVSQGSAIHISEAVYKLSDSLRDFFGSRVAYLGPLRASPGEMTRSDVRGSYLGTRGENTPSVLHALGESEIEVPMPDGYERPVSLREALNGWLQWFGLADGAITKQANNSIDLSVTPPGSARSMSLSSVGVGVSQVLPIILLCLLSKPADLLILEQPELHLHPALQKRMADFLLTFVHSGRQALVETHSDYLVNRLRTQVAADPTDETRKLVKLLFAEQTDGITSYRESEVNEYGGLSEDWPDGFLDISAKSAHELVRHTLRKMKLRKARPADSN